MSDRNDILNLELLIKYIEDIETIVSNHESIEVAISSIEGEYAIMMCITQMGEVVNRINSETLLKELPSIQIIGLRNRIVHGYETVDRTIIVEVLKHHIPDLKMKVHKLLKSC